MNIVTLKTFLTVVELKNLNKAAERLNVTQSTVSARLDMLEETLGQKLLLRSRRGAQMTKAGFALQRHAENTVNAWESARRAVELPEGYQSSVSISCEQDLWEGNVETWLRVVAADHPLLAIEVWPGSRHEINDWLSSGLIDAAVTHEPVAGEGISTQVFDHEELLLVCAAAAAGNAEFIAVDHGPQFRRQLAAESQDARFTFGTGGSRWALDQILAGGFYGFLPASLVSPYLQNGRLAIVDDSASYRIVSHLSWRLQSAAEHRWLASAGQ